MTENENYHKKMMLLAINESKKALKINEVPIGAIIVQNGKRIAKAYNKRESSKIATHHAEILAIEIAWQKNWRLET